MSTRTFIFCDACNPLGLRTEKDGFIKNRRSSDNRTWFEGDEKEALNIGWTKTANGRDLCPKCQRNSLVNGIPHKNDNSSRRFVGLSRKH